MKPFPPDIVEELARAREVELTTVGRRSGQERRAIVWIVVHEGVPYVRSEFGDAGQWYRNALAQSNVVVRTAGRELAARVERVVEPAIWEAVSAAYRAKYGRSGSLGVMVQPEIEPMTMALHPAG